MWGADEFGPDFQRILARACVDDPRLRGLVKRFADDGQLGFTDPAANWAWRLIAAEDRPTLLLLETESRRVRSDDPARIGIQAMLTELSSDFRGYDYARKQIIEWARRQVFRKGFEESRTSWNNNDFEGAMTIMMRRIDESNEITILDEDRGWFFEDFDERQSRRAYSAHGLDTFPTGIDAIDKLMYGGLHYGECGVWMGYAKSGKTFALGQQGVLTARSRRRVLHFPLEGGRKGQEDRYDAAFAEAMFGEVRVGKFADTTAERMRREYAILKQNLVVRGFSDNAMLWRVGIDEIMGEIRALREGHGWVPDMIIVDYGDLMMADGDDERSRQKNAFRQLKSLSERVDFPGHRGYAVWTGTQAQRPLKGSEDKEEIMRGRDVADSYEKIRIVNAILTINRTTQEAIATQARVHLSEYRHNESGITVRVTTKYAQGMFCVPGELHEPAPPKVIEAAGGSSAPVT